MTVSSRICPRWGSLVLVVLCCACGFGWLGSVSAAVVVSEMMYHPASEDDREEFLELHNTGETPVSVRGWQLGPGVSFRFPEVGIAPRGFLVVAANMGVFSKLHPGVTNVVGDWSGRLSNSGENVELANEAGVVQSAVRYSNDGDWGTRVLGEIDHGHRGWTWMSAADGGGQSLELINPELDPRFGGNWSPSLVKGGTPGAVNSVNRSNIPPIITEVSHFPVVPRSTQAVHVVGRVVDESSAGIEVILHYRIDGEAAFREIPMADDAVHGDGRAGDGVYGAVIEPQPDLSIVEFFLTAKDGSGLSRAWPAPALADGVSAQTVNALFQVEDAAVSDALPCYRFVMTRAEAALLRQINVRFPVPPYPSANQSASHAQFNATFISRDGEGTSCRYNVGVRNRGNGSQSRQPQSFRVNFRNDGPWKDVSAINLNGVYPHLQLLGSVLYRHAGMAAQSSRAVRLRWNGLDAASPGLFSFGFHVCNEVLNSDFTRHQFPEDSEGNVYRGIRIDNEGGANLRYQGESPDPYRTNYFKWTHVSQDDWSDLIELTRVLQQASEEEYAREVRRVIDVEAWMLYFAVETIVDNKETNLANANNGTGPGDDYFLYRGVKDRRFRVLPYDLDTILGGGDSPGITTDGLFRMNVNPIIARFMRHPEFAPVYFKTLDRLLNTTFAPGTLTNLVEQTLGGLVPRAAIDTMLRFNLERSVFVRSQIPSAVEFRALPGERFGYPWVVTGKIDLSGVAPAVGTAKVLVNGLQAAWSAADASWSALGVGLFPGINRVLVQALGADGAEIARASADLWSDVGSGTAITGNLNRDTVWPASLGPYRVSGVMKIPSGVSLTLEPGTTVFLGPGARLVVDGKLEAVGRPSARIRFARTPGSSGDWGHLAFLQAKAPSRIAFADIEYGGAAGQVILAEGSDLELDQVRFAHCTAQYVTLKDTSFTISGCEFPSLTNAELIHGTGVPATGRAIFRGNRFGGTTGLNDIIDFSGGRRPGAVLEILDNVFTSASDDVLDLDGTEALIEGNVFMNTHQSASDVDTSSAVSGGREGGLSSELMVVRNFFFDCDHMALAKEGNFYTLLHNTALGMTKSGVQFDEPGRRISDGVFPGRGALLEGNIVWQTATNVEDAYRSHPLFGTTEITLRNNLLSGTDLPGLAVGNLRSDPRFRNSDPRTIDAFNIRESLKLRPDSPAVGAGAGGLDLGAGVAPGLHIRGEPSSVTWRTDATLWVYGPGMIEYRYKLNDGAWSASQSVTNPIHLEGLKKGSYEVRVLGRNWAGRWDAEEQAKVSRRWIVDPASGGVRLNEVLAVGENGNPGAFIELFNDGGSAVDLSGWGVTDTPSIPHRFRFPPGARIESGAYLLISTEPTFFGGGSRSGFRLHPEGDDVFLFDANMARPHEVDRVGFGAQLAGYSIGRDDDGSWSLHQATPGQANAKARVGEPRDCRINEWMGSFRAGFSDGFVELHNPSLLPVDLGGFSITDNPVGAARRTVIPDLTFIAARSSLALRSGSGKSAQAGELNFRVRLDEGLIALIDRDGNRVDWIAYGPRAAGVAQGRSPDGAETVRIFEQPTPGGGNPFMQNLNVITNLVATLVALTNVWSYDATGVDRGVAWRNPSFDDSAWSRGKGLLYANTDSVPQPKGDAFSTRGQTTFFRTPFQLPENLKHASFSARSLVDDGFVAYLNGVEIARLGMPLGEIGFGTSAARTVSGAHLEGPFEIPAELFQTSRNVLAVEVHQASTGSGDVVFGFSLEARVLVTNRLAQATQVVINEVAAPPGIEPTWIELYNPSSGVLDLSGLSISDDAAQPRRYVIPDGQRIPAGGYWTISCDGTLPASVVNTGFGLKSSGGVVLLFDRAADGGALLQSLRYGLQIVGFSLSRVPDGAESWKLGVMTPLAANLSASLGDPKGLRINEWMASPSSGNDWLELYNPSDKPVALGGIAFSDDPANPVLSPMPALSFIGGGTNGFIRFEADGAPSKGALHLDFKLSASGETLTLTDPAGAKIDQVSFGTQKQDVAQGRVPDGADAIIALPGTGTPGQSNFQRAAVVINEVLAHTDPPQEDAIEIYNPTAVPQSIGGWFLSNAESELKKFRVPPGTVVPANGYVVLYEFQFNGGDGSRSAFTFNSAHGDDAILTAVDASGNLTGTRAVARFGSSANGVSFARYVTSVGEEFVPSSRTSFGSEDAVTLPQFRGGRGASNAPPLIGPLVITEIMYHPPDIGLSDNTAEEYIELKNVGPSALLLYDPNAEANTWRLKGGVDFNFPPQTVVEAGALVLVLNFDPATNTAAASAFRTKFQVPQGVRMFGPYSGKLGNTGEEVGIYKPDPPQLPPHPDAGFVPYVLVERLKYLPSAPWPEGANGTGLSLHRRSINALANEPAQWIASGPTPGRESQDPGDADTDGDGLSDRWELAHGLDPKNPADAALDSDGDGFTNAQEFLLGTDPRSASSALRFESAGIEQGNVALKIRVGTGKAATLEAADSPTGPWTLLQSLAASADETVITVRDAMRAAGGRYYRVVVSP